MNKKIKGYELYKMVAEKELKSPVKMIDNNEEMWEFDGKNFRPITFANGVDDITFAEMEFVILDLKTLGVEILEDEEETGISKLEKEKVLEEDPAKFRYDLKYYYDKEKMGDKINEIIKKVNELDKKINKE